MNTEITNAVVASDDKAQYDEKVKRRLKREQKEKRENMPAPKILGD